MKPTALLLLLALATGCSAPAVVSVPPPVPLAAGPAGATLSGGLGTSATLRGRSQATLTVRPVDDVGLFASGIWASGGTTGEEPGLIRDSQNAYAEVGAMAAVPVSESAWVTASLARGVGAASGEGRQIDTCGLFTCSTSRFDLTADFTRTAAYGGVHFENPGGVQLDLGVRLAHVEYRNVRRGTTSPAPRQDFSAWLAEPSVMMTFPTGYGAFQVMWLGGTFVSDVPQVQDLTSKGPEVSSENTSITLGLTFDLWRPASVE